MATDRNSEYVILIAFPLHQWLNESASGIGLYVHCLSCYNRDSLYSLRGTNEHFHCCTVHIDLIHFIFYQLMHLYIS